SSEPGLGANECVPSGKWCKSTAFRHSYARSSKRAGSYAERGTLRITSVTTRSSVTFCICCGRRNLVSVPSLSQQRKATLQAALTWHSVTSAARVCRRICGKPSSGFANRRKEVWRLHIMSRTPATEVLLATLAAECAGDSHALDRGQPL